MYPNSMPSETVKIQTSWLMKPAGLDHTVIYCLEIRSYSKTCVKRPLLKRPKIGFQDHLSLNAGQKYCRMLQEEHSAILLTFIKLPFVIKIFVLSIFLCGRFTHVLLYHSVKDQ